jgi:hypothetical protein
METLVIDTVIEDDFLKIPQKYRNKRVKVIIIDSEEKERDKKKTPRKLNFKIDETLDDVVPLWGDRNCAITKK